jgi:Family of unknown function (DUF6497)
MVEGAMLVQAEGVSVTEGPDAPIAVPSGQLVTLQDVVWNAPGPDGLTLRFRFVAPAIAREGGNVDFDMAMADMLHLCQSYALPRVSSTGPQPSQIVISLSDVAVPFGEAAPEATQYFEAYAIREGLCIWEMF